MILFNLNIEFIFLTDWLYLVFSVLDRQIKYKLDNFLTNKGFQNGWQKKDCAES